MSDEKNALLFNELVEELKAANRIIINALNIMTQDQLDEWGVVNDRDDVSLNGVTRNSRREQVLAKAGAK